MAIAPRSRRSTPRDAGYTLIEMSAVVAIALVLILAGIATLQSVRKADISTSAQRLSASVRYLYDLAVVTNRPYRLVVDLASGAYWGEPADPGQGCGAALLPSDEERRFGTGDEEGGEGGGAATAAPTPFANPGGIEAVLGGAPMAPAQARPATGGEGDEDAPAAKKTPRERLLARWALPKGIRFPKVMTGHQDEPTEEGKAEVWFFPSGYVEPAYIYLQRDDETYTVETVPLRGSAVVHHVELDPRDLLDAS
jgi:prepilin-type N-terminal cleavage/methylation domain-containing protein